MVSTKIEKLRKKVKNESLSLLKKYNKAVIVRPTGFGKTSILVDILKNFNNVVYLYPHDIIRQTAIKFYNDFNNTDFDTIPNTTFITYSRLLRMKDTDYENIKQADLIICDECHKLGAPKTKMAMFELLKALPEAKLLGATATPERMDMVDEIDMFFENHVVSRYTLHNAFQDKILPKPYYCFCSYTSENFDELKHEVRMEVDKFDNAADRQNMKSLLNSRLIEISNLTKMDNVIKTTCDEYLTDTKNMKFIIFCASFAHLHEIESKIIDWFHSAYPKHSISSTIVSSEKKEYRENIHKLCDNTQKKKHIELIFSCDMLNMGYHINDISGIIMYRGTESGTVYAQQIGRVLSSGNSESKIVFDLVDNIHRESVYTTVKHQNILKKTRLSKLNKLIEKREASKTNENIIFTDSDEAELVSLERLLNTDDNHWWKEANVIEPTDLIATGHMATYKELIAKTVAEPIAMRSRQAWARWIEKGGDPMDMTAVNILKQTTPDAVPLEPFCRLKQVTVKNVLDAMHVR